MGACHRVDPNPTYVCRLPFFRAAVNLSWANSVNPGRPGMYTRSKNSQPLMVGSPSGFRRACLTSMIGNRQGKTEISLDLAE